MQPMPYRPSVLRTTGLTLGAAAAGIVTFLVVQGSLLPADGSEPPPGFLALMVLDLLLGLAAVGLLPLAIRRAPLGAGLPIIALSSLSSLAFIPACMALIGIAALRRPRALVAAAAAYAAAVAVDLAVHPDGDLPALVGRSDGRRPAPRRPGPGGPEPRRPAAAHSLPAA